MPYTDFHYTPTGTGVISGKEVLEQTEDAINDLGGQISGDVQTAIDTANNALNTANTASTDAQNAVNTANTAYTAATNAQNTANAAQNTASNALTAAQNAQNDVNALGNRVTTAENNITQNTTDISGLTTRMGTAEGNITNLQNDVVTAQGTATSAQNTATMARQQAYVLRYSSTAITDNSTIAYSTLDNTDNIKVSDKIIDTDGKIFSIVSVDSDNSTVTVGSALVDLALDANVVHTSGNETVGGAKTFSSTPVIYNSDISGSTSNLYLRNQLVIKGDTSTGGNQVIRFSDSSDKMLSRIQTTKVSNGTTTLNLRAETVDTNNNDVATEIQVISGREGSKSLSPQNDNAVDLGRTLAKWKNIYINQINGLTPSSLGMPSDTSIDISGYITDFSGGSNLYTAPDNGIVAVDISGTNKYVLYNNNLSIGDRLTGTNFRRAGIIQVRKNDAVIIQSNGGTLIHAKFFPCFGNV